MSKGNADEDIELNDWRDDVDKKLDRLVTFADAYEPFVRSLLEREQNRQVLRRAVIEKTLIALIWSCIVVTAAALWNYLKENLHVK